jgi:hypothetical protein
MSMRGLIQARQCNCAVSSESVGSLPLQWGSVVVDGDRASSGRHISKSKLCYYDYPKSMWRHMALLLFREFH